MMMCMDAWELPSEDLTKREIKPVTANQIKELGPGLCADVQQILKPLRDQKGGPFSFSFQQRIGRHSGAHSDPANQRGVHRLLPWEKLASFLSKQTPKQQQQKR